MPRTRRLIAATPRRPGPAEWSAEQIARAAYFTVARFRGRGAYDTRRFATLAEARAEAAGDRRAMVYAVTPEGITVHVENGGCLPEGFGPKAGPGTGHNGGAR
ncbi:hypothetical protein [Elioraea sp.]|uniref:hypothetical protein n=1 Tax=Elioraea sp. TaxID=2185103 RepID=UPI003F70EC3C